MSWLWPSITHPHRDKRQNWQRDGSHSCYDGILQVGVNLPLLRTAVESSMYTGAANEKPICRPTTDTGLDLQFSPTLHFCPIGNLCPTKRVFPPCISRKKGEVCTFLTQLAGPCSPGEPLPSSGTSAPSSPLSTFLVLSALLCWCQSLTPFKERTLCCATADVSSHGD